MALAPHAAPLSFHLHFPPSTHFASTSLAVTHAFPPQLLIQHFSSALQAEISGGSTSSSGFNLFSAGFRLKEFHPHGRTNQSRVVHSASLVISQQQHTNVMMIPMTSLKKTSQKQCCCGFENLWKDSMLLNQTNTDNALVACACHKRTMKPFIVNKKEADAPSQHFFSHLCLLTLKVLKLKVLDKPLVEERVIQKVVNIRKLKFFH